MDFNDLKGMFGEVKTPHGRRHRPRPQGHGVGAHGARHRGACSTASRWKRTESRVPIKPGWRRCRCPSRRSSSPQPFDPSTMKEIEKAIRSSDLGLTPSNDGKVIRIPIPPLTDDRRKELSRHVPQAGRGGAQRRPQRRRDANDRLKKLLRSTRSRRTTSGRGSITSRR